MLFLRRLGISLACFMALGRLSPASPAASAAALPVLVDAVSFRFELDGQFHKVTVTSSPKLVRVDESDDGLSVIYNPQTQFYTGLENRNYTYWEFSWPQVSAVVQNSKRYEARLQQLSGEGLIGDLTPPSTNAPASGTTVTDDSGYVWHPTTEHKRVAEIDCVRWVGDTVSGEPVEAWCGAGLLPKVLDAVAKLREMNGPMALVPIRTIAPDFIFPVYDALTKGGVTPLEINWGDPAAAGHFMFLEARTREAKPVLFAVPKLYIKTTLVTMDGMLNQKP